MAYKLKSAKTKEQARQVGIAFQDWASKKNLSYSEISYYRLRKMAKTFGLIREFRENGII